MNALRYVDIILIAITAPVVALLGAPVLGTLVGALAWIVQRIAAISLERAAQRKGDVRSAVGLNLAGVFGRAWLVTLTILAVGLAGDREDGLAAAVLTLVAFTLYFIALLLARMLEKDSAIS